MLTFYWNTGYIKGFVRGYIEVVFEWRIKDANSFLIDHQKNQELKMEIKELIEKDIEFYPQLENHLYEQVDQVLILIRQFDNNVEEFVKYLESKREK